jgi:hypothetical protein
MSRARLQTAGAARITSRERSNVRRRVATIEAANVVMPGQSEGRAEPQLETEGERARCAKQVCWRSACPC